MKKLLLIALLFIAGYNLNAQPTLTFVNKSCIPVYAINIVAENSPYCPGCSTRVHTTSPILIPIGTTTFSTPTSGGLTWGGYTPGGMFTYVGVLIAESTSGYPCGATNGFIGESWPGICCSSSAFPQVCTTHCQPNITCIWSSGGPGTNVTVYIN